MAITLEEVKESFQTKRAEVSRMMKEQRDKKKAMKDNDVVHRLSVAIAKKEALQDDYEEYKKLISNDKLSDSDRAKYESEMNDVKAQLDVAISEEEAVLREKEEYTVSVLEERRLETARQEIKDLVEGYVAVPEVNEHLQKGIKHTYSKKLKKFDDMSEESNRRFEELKTVLESPDLQPEVEALKATYAEKKRVDSSTIGTVDIGVKIEVYTQYENAMKNLRKKLASLGVLEEIALLQDDYDSIAEGNYVVPSKDREAVRINEDKDKIMAKRDRELAILESKKVISNSNVPAELQAKVDKNKADIEANDKELADVIEKLQAITDNEAEFTSLKEKMDGLQEKKEYDNANAEYKDALKVLKDAGYISEEVIPELGQPDSDISKKFREYAVANKEFREAMLAYQQEPTEANFTKIMDKLKAYKDIAKALDDLTGMDAEAWNKYYVSKVIESGDPIDDIFYDDNALSVAERIENSYKLKTPEQKEANLEVKELAEKLADFQTRLLNGKGLSVDEVKDLRKGYPKAIENLANELGVEKKQIFETLKAKLLAKTNRVVSLLKGLPIIRKFMNTKTRKELTVDYPNTVTREAIEKVKTTREEARKKKGAFDKARKDKFPDESKRYEDLLIERENKESYESRKAAAEAKKTQLKNEHAVLANELANVQPARSSLDISDAEYIEFTNMSGVNNEVKKTVEREAREIGD